MEIKVQTIKFDASDKLQAYAEKRINKLTRFCDNIESADIVLKVVKPETATNKEASITLLVPNSKYYASKVANTFEQAIDECATALEKQVEKRHKDHQH